MSRILTRGAWLLALTLFATALPLHAQGWRDKLKKVEKKVEGAAGDASKGADKASKGADAAGATETKAAADASSAEAATGASFDFVPGTKVIFQDDFSQDPVNDLPTRVKIESGNWEIANYQGRKVLKCTDSCNLMVPLGTMLPEKFTLEMDVIHDGGRDMHVYFLPSENDARSGHNDVFFGYRGGIGDFGDNPKFETSNVLYHPKLMVDGEHAKVYENNERLANVPAARLGRSNALYIAIPGYNDHPAIIENIRVAASEKSLFDALSADGRVATHGILFATGSDRIQPESGPTLKEIGEMLQQHGDLKLTIEGHTDNVGQPAANLTLSQKRADAVKQYLVSNYQVDASRLDTKGYGDSKPVASNANEDGRQQNRRVELVKM